MNLDLLAIAVRTLALGALFVAAGGGLFVCMAGVLTPPQVGKTIAQLIRGAATAALLLLAADACLQAARLGGDLGGVIDPELEGLFWRSPAGTVHLIQLLALAVVLGCGSMRGRWAGRLTAVAGTVAVAALAGTGHTSLHPWRLALSPLLVLHTCVGAFWLGSLVPLWLVLGGASAAVACRVLSRFSAVAGVVVTALGVAGVLMLALLAPDVSVLLRPYGQLVMVKFLFYLTLLALAAWNRWRGTRALAAERPGSARALQHILIIEFLLILAVLGVTATLTACCGPEDG